MLHKVKSVHSAQEFIEGRYPGPAWTQALLLSSHPGGEWFCNCNLSHAAAGG